MAHYRARLERFAELTVRDKEAARDLVGEVYAAVLQNISSVKSESLLPYLYTAVRRRCLNFRRDSARRKLIRGVEGEMEAFYTSVISDFDPHEIFRNEILENLRSCLSELPEESAGAWRLSRLEGKTYKEIAEQLGISVKRVDKAMQKAARALRRRLEDFL